LSPGMATDLRRQIYKHSKRIWYRVLHASLT